jgi:hypothetical protein
MSKTVTVQANQDIIDVCLQEYGSVEFLWDIHIDNKLLEFPEMLPASFELSVYPDKITGSRRTATVPQPHFPEKVTVTVLAGQNIVDVCLQEYGLTDFLWDIHTDNLAVIASEAKQSIEFPAMLPAGFKLSVFPDKITGSRRTPAILKPYFPGTGSYMPEALSDVLNDALFHNAYMYPDNYMYTDSYLFEL